MDLRGLGAVVTGGGSGLGEATVRALASEGARVCVLDLNFEKAEAVASDVGDSAIAVAANVTDPDEVAAAIDKAHESFGGIHVAVNCAGIGSVGRTVARDGTPFDLNHFKQVIEINLIGTFNVLRLAASKMLENEPNEQGERGVIVNTASIGAFDGQIGQVAYAASKGGVVSMTLPIARDLAKAGVRCNTIAPGLFGTPLMLLAPQPMQDALISNIPFPHRFGVPAEFAALCTHIVSNPMLNGETIRLDGALRMPPK